MAPPDVTASDGEDAAVTCAAEGDPPPQWSFSFNGVTLGNQGMEPPTHGDVLHTYTWAGWGVGGVVKTI